MSLTLHSESFVGCMNYNRDPSIGYLNEHIHVYPPFLFSAGRTSKIANKNIQQIKEICQVSLQLCVQERQLKAEYL